MANAKRSASCTWATVGVKAIREQAAGGRVAGGAVVASGHDGLHDRVCDGDGVELSRLSREQRLEHTGGCEPYACE